MVRVKEEEEEKNAANGAVAAVLRVMRVVREMVMDHLPQTEQMANMEIQAQVRSFFLYYTETRVFVGVVSFSRKSSTSFGKLRKMIRNVISWTI